MTQLALAVLGGGLGAAGRYALGLWFGPPAGAPALPVGTLVVNVVGCLVIGVVLGFAEGREALGPALRAFLVIGVLGGFTTFSAFGWDTFELARQGHWLLAGSNVMAQLGLGLLAVGGGFALGRAV
ncbi:MAG: fluoride efflux transporter CrcB [Planctomycetota bacterium]|nr:fluoride efflux transporter CrcB [Planctomycetota bacterium]